jgi:hypothetical protein
MPGFAFRPESLWTTGQSALRSRESISKRYMPVTFHTKLARESGDADTF